MANPKEQYNYFYNRLYPLLKEGRIDFARVAGKTGFKERKIREALQFRLTAGEVRQLFGKKDGHCFLCNHSLPSGSKEPMCLSCLQSIDTAVNEIQLDVPRHKHEHESEAAHLQEAAPRGESEPPPHRVNSEMSDIETQIAERMENRSANRTRFNANTAESVLNILDMDDEDAAIEDVEVAEDEGGHAAPIRQFGFQRLKSRS